jgi:hypothetical protein
VVISQGSLLWSFGRPLDKFSTLGGKGGGDEAVGDEAVSDGAVSDEAVSDGAAGDEALALATPSPLKNVFCGRFD